MQSNSFIDKYNIRSEVFIHDLNSTPDISAKNTILSETHTHENTSFFHLFYFKGFYLITCIYHQFSWIYWIHAILNLIYTVYFTPSLPGLSGKRNTKMVCVKNSFQNAPFPKFLHFDKKDIMWGSFSVYFLFENLRWESDGIGKSLIDYYHLLHWSPVHLS